MLLTSASPDPLRSIRSAIDSEESGNHIVRVAEEGTGEIYDLTLSHTAPYAAPVQASLERAQRSMPQDGQSQDHARNTSSGSDVTSAGGARRILQLPQIVSRRAGVSPDSRGNAASPAPEAQEMADLNRNAPVAALHQQQQQYMAPPRQPPMVGELPPSPPLEADHLSSEQMHGGPFASFNGTAVNDGMAKATAQQARAPKAPRRAQTAQFGALGEEGVATSANIARRQGSVTSTASTNYLTASEDEAEAADKLNTGPPKLSLGTLPSADPSSFLPMFTQTPDGIAAPRAMASGSMPRGPSRRNTTGSAPRRPPSASSIGTQRSRKSSRERAPEGGGPPASFYAEPQTPGATYAAAPLRTGDAGLDEEMARQAEVIRREREKRARVAREAAEARAEEEASAPTEQGLALTRRKSAAAGRKETIVEEPRALVGNIIGEGHANYILMYNMLTGIRIGVSRCQAKLQRPLAEADYSAKHKFTFDIVGNELTPSAKYDFKFKDYAPWVFRELREFFHLDPADYLLSLTAKYILSELGSPGKSGSFFYFSRDYRFIIKTIRHGEHKFLLSILKEYHEHIKANPHTLLSRFYGLHRVKLPRGRKIHFVIMNNLFPPHRDVHETYDLKGSAIGREYPEEKAAQKKGAVLKDLNWIHRGRELELGPEKRALLETQLKADVALLQRLKIMDYSLLIGLHDMKRGNTENLRQDALQVFQPDAAQGVKVQALSPGPEVLTTSPTSNVATGASAMPTIGSAAVASAATMAPLATPNTCSEGASSSAGPSQPTRMASKRGSSRDDGPRRGTVRRSGDPRTLSTDGTARLPEQATTERELFCFYQDEGGFRSTNENNEPTDQIYYFGIIDTLTLYNSVKRGEHYWKSLMANKHMISAVPPKEYGERFKNFLLSIIKGADKSKRPRME